MASGSLEISNFPSGQPAVFMTFGMHYCGTFQGVRDGAVILADVRLVSETGAMLVFTLGKAIPGQAGHYSEPIYADPETEGRVPIDVVQFFGPLSSLPVRR